MSFLHIAYLLKNWCLLVRCNRKREVSRYTEVPVRSCIRLLQNKQVKRPPPETCFVALL